MFKLKQMFRNLITQKNNKLLKNSFHSIFNFDEFFFINYFIPTAQNKNKNSDIELPGLP